MTNEEIMLLRKVFATHIDMAREHTNNGRVAKSNIHSPRANFNRGLDKAINVLEEIVVKYFERGKIE